MYKFVLFINNFGNIILVWVVGGWIINFCVFFWYFVKVRVFVGL